MEFKKVITDEQLQVVGGLKERIKPLLKQIDPSPIWWISGGGSVEKDFCHGCVNTYLEKVKKDYPDAIADGGYEYFRVNDGPVYCSDCGIILSYSLSQTGLAGEVQHFMDADKSKYINAEIAFEISAMLCELEWCEDKSLISDAIDIANVYIETTENSGVAEI